MGAACSQAFIEDDGGPGVVPQPSADARLFPDAATLPALSVDYADPSHGPFGGGTQVTLRGRGFAAGMAVAFGGRSIEAAAIQVLDAHRALVTSPAGEPGPADIVVTAGANGTTRQAGFVYDPVTIDPPRGSSAGGTFVRIQGLGTTFGPGTTVSLDGEPLTGVIFVNAQELTGYTPSGEPGAATLRVTDGDTAIVAADAYTYVDTTASDTGGFGGGHLDGTLNFTLIDDFTGNGIPNAYVVIGDPATSSWKGVTDPFGQITFSGPGLTGPITVTAGHPKYETGAFVGFDAADATMFVVPLPPDPNDPPPDFGPAPPGRSPGTVSGDIVFGGSTGLGTDTSWPLVPDPDPTHSGEIKRTYIFTTAGDIFGSSPNPGDGGTVDYRPGQDAWHFSIPVRPSAFALVALAGLYNPDGNVFVPYAMGVLRNLVAGPGEDMQNVSIPITVPLDTAILVRLKDTPALGVAGTGGPDQYQVTAVIDLGGEGVIRLPNAHATFSDKPEVILPSMAPIGGPISDASYSFVVGAYTAKTFAPYSVRIIRGVRDLSAPVVIDGFLGVPRAVDPPASGSGTVHHLVLGADGGTAHPTFSYQRVTLTDGTPVYRILARGDRAEVPLYDLTGGGLPPLTPMPLLWSVTTIVIPGGSFDTFDYGQLNANLWAAYAADSFSVAFP